MKIWPLFIAVFVLSSFSGKWVNNSLHEQGLKGKVRSVTEYEYGVAKDKIFSKRINVFDTLGNEVADSSFSYDTLYIATKWDYKYNELGNKTEENIYNPDGSLSWKTLFDYDKKGLLHEARRNHSNGAMEEKYVYRFNADGYNIEVTSYNNAGAVNCIKTYKYNDRGTITDMTDDCSNIPDLEDIFSSKYVYKYSENRSTKENMEYNRKQELLKYTQNIETAFDSKGNWIERTVISERYRHAATYKDTTVEKREIAYYK